MSTTTPTTSRLRSTALALTTTLLGGVCSYALFGGAAEAVPLPQSKCAFGQQHVTTADGWRPLSLGVSIDNGTVSRRVLTQLAADIGVDDNAEVRVGYSVDGGPVREKVYGPGNLANHTDFWQTRSTLAVIPLGAGRHTVTPYIRISGAPGMNAFFEGGCFTAEGRTR